MLYKVFLFSFYLISQIKIRIVNDLLRHKERFRVLKESGK